MPSVTRYEAITEARIGFQRYASDLIEAGRLSREYLAELTRYWDRRLSGLARLGSDLPVADEVLASLRIIAREVQRRDLDPDAAVRWLDAFPERVADLFPPSDVTFRLISEAEQREATESFGASAINSAA